MDKMFADSGNLISREDYAKGYALYAIDLTQDTIIHTINKDTIIHTINQDTIIWWVSL